MFHSALPHQTLDKSYSEHAGVEDECCPADRILRSQEALSTDLGIENFLNGSGYHAKLLGSIPVLCSVEQFDGCWKIMGFFKCDAMGSRIHVPVLSILLTAVTGTDQKD